MKILLLVHPGFFVRAGQERAWIEEYSSQLKGCGHETKRFDPLQDKVAAYDWAHIFSREDPETWHSLPLGASRVLVTPSLEPVPPPSSAAPATGREHAAIRAIARIGRAALQRRWPPVDPSSFYECARHYFVASTEWEEILIREWRVERQRISLLPGEPFEAALAIHRFTGNSP